ncbi:hypothetical protein BGZ81_004786 [Podila clonocystis]|nr:hypothetical protein BGZ81_004786 [Podila clonocystis]
MSKRGGEDQITKDNYDDDANDGSNETMGTFKKASNDEISKRIGGGDAPKAPSAFASFGTTPTAQSGFGVPAVNFSSTSFSAGSTTSFTGFGDTPKSAAFTFGDKPAPSTFTGFGDKPATAFTSFGGKPAATGFGDKPAPAFTSFGDKPAATGFGDKPASSFASFGDKPAATGFGDKPAPSFTSFGDKPAATGFGDKPAPTFLPSGFGLGQSLLDQAKTSPFTSFGDKPALSSTPNPFGDKISAPSFTGFGDKASTTPAFTGFAKESATGSSTFKAFPDTRTTTGSTTTTTTTTTTLNGRDNTPKPFVFKPTTAPSSVTSTSNKTALKSELYALNRNFIDKLQGAMNKEHSVNLAQVFNKYTESRLKIKKSHSGSGSGVKDVIMEPKKSIFGSSPPAPLPSSKHVGFGGVGGFGLTSSAPIELFTGRNLNTDKPEGISTGRKLSEDENEIDEDEYNRNLEDWEEQQEFEGHYNRGVEDEYEEVDENDENDYNQDEEDERDDEEAEEADEEPKPKPFGGFNFGVADAAKPKPATFNFGVNFPSSTTASSTSTTATTTAFSGSGGAFSNSPFGASTGGAFGNLTSKGSDSAPKTTTPAWNFGGPASSSATTSQSTSAPTSTPSLFSTPANPFSSASSVTPAPFAPPKPFSFTVPGASTSTSTTTPAPFSGFQVPARAPAAASGEAESDKMPDDTKSELVDERVGEEDEKTVFEVKAKLYAVEGGENKDKGVGQFRVNENSETKKRRMIMRIAGTGQLLLNSWVIQKMPPKREKNIVTLFAIDDGKPKRFMLRVKEESSAIELVKELELGQLDE